MYVDSNEHNAIKDLSLKQLSKLILSGEVVVSDMTLDHLNKIALGGGIIGNVSMNYSNTNRLPNNHHGYGFRYIRPNGINNAKDDSVLIVLIARGDSASEHIRQGRVAKLVKHNDLSYIEADALISATYGVRYGMDRDVLNYIVELRDNVALVNYPAKEDELGKTNWLIDNGIFRADIPIRKMDVVAQIHSNWRLK